MFWEPEEKACWGSPSWGWRMLQYTRGGGRKQQGETAESWSPVWGWRGLSDPMLPGTPHRDFGTSRGFPAGLVFHRHQDSLLLTHQSLQPEPLVVVKALLPHSTSSTHPQFPFFLHHPLLTFSLCRKGKRKQHWG